MTREKIVSRVKKQLTAKLKYLYNTPFYFGRAKLFNLYLAFRPDSDSFFGAHPEYDLLFKRFTQFNTPNNAGDSGRLWSFILNIKQIISENIEGDFAELGVWRGNTAAVLAYFAAKDDRKVYLFDTFEGFDKKDLKNVDADKVISFNNTSLDMVRDVIGPESKACELVKGYFPDSIRDEHKDNNYAVVSLDCDLYEPMKAGLDFFYPLMPRGGIFLLHDYSSCFWVGAKQAIDEFCHEKNEFVILMPDKSGSAFIRKSR